MAAHSSFLLQRSLNGLAALSSNYWIYAFNDTRFQKTFKKVLDIFVLLVTFEVISHYPNTAAPNAIKKTFKGPQMKYS